MDAEKIKLWIETISHLFSILAIGAAAWWFFRTTKSKPRIQFDIDCKFLSLTKNDNDLIAELQFIFENKGFIEHRLYNLTVSIHAVESEKHLKEKAGTREFLFLKTLLPNVSIVPKKYGFYFVRPGVRQIITHIIRVPKAESIIRVTAGFDYNRSGKYPHTSRRVFEVHQSSQDILAL